VCQRPEVFNRRTDVVLQLIHQGPGPFGVAPGDLFEKPHLDGKRNQMLLGAVVQITFDSPAFGVCRCDKSASRSLQLKRLPAQSLERVLQRSVEPRLVQRHG